MRLFAWLHVVLGWALVASIALTIVPLLRARSLRADLRALARVGIGDYLWLQHAVLRAMGSPSRPPRSGKFNTGQKLNALISALLTAGLVASGVVLGVNYTTKSVFDVAFVEGVFPWHTALALLAIPPADRAPLSGAAAPLDARVAARDGARPRAPRVGARAPRRVGRGGRARRGERGARLAEQ